MKPQDKLAIENMRLDGITPAEIASRLHLSPNTVYSHIRRHPKLPNARTCLNCGKPVKQFDGHKAKKYCSDKCRMAWWNSHQDEVKRKAFYTLTCSQCGKEFISYGNKDRKFCCRECYLDSRRPLQL
ncbi:sigma factor-like helix-turn-helix DNA-binding protein [Faecalispora jeddahensis]|uniref:sigma-70 region 4 domain-containing protein n=1 Tax=Faecalispora jeddahensis TaxID=1414721 RepID=UPI00145B3C89|nr:sigma-70 region 4 domain-containing protein [Faecalispora jeddahensis]NLM15284.1 helix-turn-helix domain-containing protein [Clostridiaceae bacterium]